MSIWRLLQGIGLLRAIIKDPSEEEVSEYIRSHPHEMLKQTSEDKKLQENFQEAMTSFSQILRDGMGEEAYLKWRNGDPEGRKAYDEFMETLKKG